MLIKKISVSVLLLAAVYIFFASATPALAAGVKIDPSYHPTNAPTITGKAAESADEKGLTVDSARVQFFARIINVILGIVGIIAVFSLINNAWWMIASAGQEEALTQRKKGLKWAIFGLILVILSYSIIRWIISIPFLAHEAPPVPPAETLEKVSVPGGKLGDDSPLPSPSVEELKQMDEDKYFQQPPEGGYEITNEKDKSKFQGTPPDIKSEGSLEDEFKKHQEVQKFESEMEQDTKTLKKMDVPKGKFSLPPIK
ncbi:hypothetical protein HZC21_01200 [Candidatus Peregrinibacteria bacterium]|nr:hypothetical protein [Candidatus Peregrinibacteria bacterium]